MLSGIWNVGLPMGVGTIGNYLTWGYVGAGGVAALANIITAIVIKNCKATNNSIRNQADAQTTHLDLEKSKDRQRSEEAIQELYNFLFVTLINPQKIQDVQPLGFLLTPINEFLVNFNKKYKLDLKAIGSAHSSNKHDKWQTIKIIDRSINREGEKSTFLNHLNDCLHEDSGIISNGGDSGSVTRGKKKQAPVCFIKDGVTMFPQIQITLMDIKRILGITSEEKYLKELEDAYKTLVS